MIVRKQQKFFEGRIGRKSKGLTSRKNMITNSGFSIGSSMSPTAIPTAVQGCLHSDAVISNIACQNSTFSATFTIDYHSNFAGGKVQSTIEYDLARSSAKILGMTINNTIVTTATTQGVVAQTLSAYATYNTSKWFTTPPSITVDKAEPPPAIHMGPDSQQNVCTCGHMQDAGGKGEQRPHFSYRECTVYLKDQLVDLANLVRELEKQVIELQEED